MSAYVASDLLCCSRTARPNPRDPDEPPRDDGSRGPGAASRGAPRILRAGPVARCALCPFARPRLAAPLRCSPSCSTGSSARAQAAAEAVSHGETPLVDARHISATRSSGSKSFQNWQSEFLSTAVLIVLSIFLQAARIAGIEGRRRAPRPDRGVGRASLFPFVPKKRDCPSFSRGVARDGHFPLPGASPGCGGA